MREATASGREIPFQPARHDTNVTFSPIPG